MTKKFQLLFIARTKWESSHTPPPPPLHLELEKLMTLTGCIKRNRLISQEKHFQIWSSWNCISNFVLFFWTAITRHVSSMIPSARPTVPPVAIIVFMLRLFSLTIFWKVVTDVRTETCAKTMITTGRHWGLAEWINLGRTDISLRLKSLNKDNRNI